MEKIDVKECHKYLLQIAKVFHNICTKNEIPYYMLGGTQLGAIRHKGFIPWDDDMDFGVPRMYYESLLRILEKELPPEFKVHSVYNSSHYSHCFFKIEDSNTLIKEVGKSKMNTGVNIDVFPLDLTNEKRSFFSKNYLITVLSRLESYCFADMEGLGWGRSFVHKMLSFLMSSSDNKSIVDFINRHLIVDDGGYMINHYGAYGMKEIVPKYFFGTPKLYSFEDTFLYGVEQPADYLRHFYGDYMQPPKGTANHFHIEELYLLTNASNN